MNWMLIQTKKWDATSNSWRIFQGFSFCAVVVLSVHWHPPLWLHTGHYFCSMLYTCTLLSSPMADFSGGPRCSAGVRGTPALPPTHQLEQDRFIILFGVCRWMWQIAGQLWLYCETSICVYRAFSLTHKELLNGSDRQHKQLTTPSRNICTIPLSG